MHARLVVATQSKSSRSGLTPRQLAKFKQQLIDGITAIFREVHGDIRDRIGRAFTEEEQDGPRDEADESLITQLKDLNELLDEREARLAQAMEGALLRIARGEFGICEECGEAIELERLKAVPWTTRCLDDQEALEREHPRPPGL